MQVLYRKQAEAPSQSQSIDRSEGTHSPSYAFLSNCRLNAYQSYTNVLVASIVFAQHVRGVGNGEFGSDCFSDTDGVCDQKQMGIGALEPGRARGSLHAEQPGGRDEAIFDGNRRAMQMEAGTESVKGSYASCNRVIKQIPRPPNQICRTLFGMHFGVRILLGRNWSPAIRVAKCGLTQQNLKRAFWSGPVVALRAEPPTGATVGWPTVLLAAKTYGKGVLNPLFSSVFARVRAENPIWASPKKLNRNRLSRRVL
jgi:hypothetical protein